MSSRRAPQGCQEQREDTVKKGATHTKGISFFATWSSREVRTIERVLEEIVVPPGRTLCEQGTIGREFFVIVKGQATVKRNNCEVATLGPGQYFGEIALLDRRPRSATVTSETEMTLLVLGQHQFNGVLDTVPHFSTNLLAAMATRLREADQQVMAAM